MSLDLSTLTSDQLLALKARLDGLTDVSGRSPMRPRQLHDLRLLPTKDDPRPTFFWSAEQPRNVNVSVTTPFPALVWHAETGQEVRVENAKDLAAYTAAGYLTYPPFTVELDPMDVLSAQIDALSEQDRAALIESQRQDRINAIRQKLAAMPEEKLAILLAQSEKPAKSRRTALQYPKLLWAEDGTEVTVNSPEDEASKLAEGYRLTREVPIPPEVFDAASPFPFEPVQLTADPFDTEPTFGDPGDDSHSRLKARKKR